MKNVVLLGATGSIGTSSVDVIHQHSDIFNLYAVAANSSVAKVAEIVRKYKVERVCMFNEAAAKELEKVLGDRKSTRLNSSHSWSSRMPSSA